MEFLLWTASVEVAMVGCDSVVGFPGIVRKNETSFRAQAQVTGEAVRVSARVLQAAIKQESQIYLALLDHTRSLSEQIAQAVVSNHFHNTDQRLARWPLQARFATRDENAYRVLKQREFDPQASVESEWMRRQTEHFAACLLVPRAPLHRKHESLAVTQLFAMAHLSGFANGCW